MADAGYRGLLIPLVAVSVRRLHDTGRSGWRYWISPVPFWSIVLLGLLSSRSEPHPNRYGP